MASLLVARRSTFVPQLSSRWLSTTPVASTSTASSIPQPSPKASSSASDAAPEAQPLTHYKITLKRSAIGLPKKYKGTLEALGIWHREQTVFMPHSPEAAGKILRLKELVAVENVPASQVRTKLEQRQERKAPRGYVVVDKFVS